MRLLDKITNIGGIIIKVSVIVYIVTLTILPTLNENKISAINSPPTEENTATIKPTTLESYDFRVEDDSIDLVEGTISEDNGKTSVQSYELSESKDELDEIREKVDDILKKIEKENKQIEKKRQEKRNIKLISSDNIRDDLNNKITYKEVKSTGSINYQGTTIPTGTTKLPNAIYQFDSLINKYSTLFKVDKNIIRSIIAQESSANPNALTGSAAGLMQIHSTLESEFKKFGKQYFGQDWTLDDRYSPEKNIAFGTYRFRQNLEHYNGDYIKALQGYTFSHYSLDKLLKQYPTNWLQHRSETAYYNGHYERTGSNSYGDSRYVENVLRYYYK